MPKPTNTNEFYVCCPTCQQKVLWNEGAPFRPFCSKKCQLIDLGEWANESHKIASAAPLEDADLEQVIQHLSGAIDENPQH